MVKQRQRLNAKGQWTKLNQLQRHLADAARIQKDKHPKLEQRWQHIRKRYCPRLQQKKLARHQSDRADNWVYEIPDESQSKHRLNNKFKQRRACPKPIVTFREKSDTYRNAESATDHDGGPNNGFQFDLKDGRVYVPQVLNNLGVTKLQYELEPGVWRALTRLSSGESIDRFENKQEVHFRVDGSTGNRGARKDYNWIDSWFVEGDTEEAYNARVSRIVQKTGRGRIGVGTMVRVKTPLIPGLMLTCRHCVELNENGAINEKLLAFGGPVTVLYVSNKYDIALCEGPPGPDGFRLAIEGEEVKSQEIRMLSFPWHVDLVYGLLEDVGPTQVHGNVCMFSPEGCEMPMEVDALGTYMGGFPASSGGAVTLNSKVLCGIHVGVIWHDKDELSMPLVLGSKGHVEPHKNTFHMQLCARRRKLRRGNNSATTTNNNGWSQTSRNYCSSSHGYLATYVSSSHIEEAFQDYLGMLRSRSEQY